MINLKICFFHPYEYFARVGGTDIYVANLVKQLVAKYFNVFIICPGEEFKIDFVEGILVYRINIYESSKFVNLEGLKISSGFADFNKIISNEVPDLVHFHGFGKPYVPYLKVLHKVKIPAVLTPHLSSLTCIKSSLIDFSNSSCNGFVSPIKCSQCYLGNKFQKKLIAKLFSYLIFIYSFITFNKSIRSFDLYSRVHRLQSMFNILNRYISKIIVLNPWYKEVLLINNFSENKITVLQTVNKSFATKIDFKTKPFSILFAGRQSQAKGIYLLLDALSEYSLTTPIELNIIGPIESCDSIKLRNKIDSIVSSKINIIQKEHIDNIQLQDFIRKSNLVCVPSIDAEMCPLIVLEAQSLGIPVLGANHTGIKDLIKEGFNGFLFERNNLIDLIKKIEYLISNLLLLEQVNTNLIKINHEPFKLVDKHIEIYKQVISK